MIKYFLYLFLLFGEHICLYAMETTKRRVVVIDSVAMVVDDVQQQDKSIKIKTDKPIKHRSCCSRLSAWTHAQITALWIMSKGDELYREMRRAIVAADVPAVERYLSYGLNPNGVYNSRYSYTEFRFMAEAIESKSPQIVQSLINKGIALNADDVQMAFQKENIPLEIKDVLFDAMLQKYLEGGNVMRSSFKYQVGGLLNLLFAKQEKTKASSLLATGIDINDCYRLQYTQKLSRYSYRPIVCAVFSGDMHTVRTACENGAQITGDAVFAAIGSGKPLFASQVILQYFDQQKVTRENRVAFLYRILKTTLNENPHAHQLSESRLPFHLGLRVACPQLIHFLCDTIGIDPNWQDLQGNTSLDYLTAPVPDQFKFIAQAKTSSASTEERLKAFLECGAQIECVDKYNETIIHKLASTVSFYESAGDHIKILFTHPRLSRAQKNESLSYEVFEILCCLYKVTTMPSDLRVKILTFVYGNALLKTPYGKYLRTMPFGTLCIGVPRDVQYELTKLQKSFGPLYHSNQFVEWYTKEHMWVIKEVLTKKSNKGKTPLECLEQPTLASDNTVLKHGTKDLKLAKWRKRLNPLMTDVEYHWLGKVKREYDHFFLMGHVYNKTSDYK